MDTAITQQFADGEYTFFLPWPEALAVQRECGRFVEGVREEKALFQIYEEISSGVGQYRETGEVAFLGGSAANIRDIAKVIEYGLIGGNSGLVDGQQIKVNANLAEDLVKNYVYGKTMLPSLFVAYKILAAAIEGIGVKKNLTPNGAVNAESESVQTLSTKEPS